MKRIMPVFTILLSGALILQLSGCGTLMHPERKGQKGGNIDAGIAVLDGIGLLLFVIPGIIAFVVDFDNGTIYLPGTSHVMLDNKNIKQVKFDSKHSTMESIAALIKKETGQNVQLDQKAIQVSKLESLNDVTISLNNALAGISNTHLALLK